MTVDDQIKIEILLKEYESLRSHILQRLQNRFQFLALSSVIATFAFINMKEPTILHICTLIAGGLFLLALWYWLGRIVVRISLHVSEIERRINELAGEELLTWETNRAQNSILHLFH